MGFFPPVNIIAIEEEKAQHGEQRAWIGQIGTLGMMTLFEVRMAI